MKLERIYISTEPDKDYRVEYDKKSKRPSWLKIEGLNEKTLFVKIIINKEGFWYRKHLGKYFLPLKTTAEDYEIYYDKIASEYESIVPHNKELALKIVGILKKNKIKQNSEILELGAGTGLIAEILAKNNYNNLTLVDISDEMLKLAKNKPSLKNCKFIKENTLDFKTNKRFDVVYFCMHLDYFTDFETKHILQSVKDVLNKDGLIIIVDRHIPKINNFKKIDSNDFIVTTEKM